MANIEQYTTMNSLPNRVTAATATPTTTRRRSMWHNTAAAAYTAAAMLVITATATPTSAFVAPIVSRRPQLSLHPKTRMQLHVPSARSSFAGTSMIGLHGNIAQARRRRLRQWPMVMVFGGGGSFEGGGFGGGRGPKGPSGIDPGTLATIVFALLFVFAPGVIFGAFNTIFLAITVGPILLSLGFNLYTKFNSIEGPCPVCRAELQSFKNSQSQCPSCGAMLVANKGEFETVGSGYVRDETGRQQEYSRMEDSGVIDVDAIDVED